MIMALVRSRVHGSARYRSGDDFNIKTINEATTSNSRTLYDLSIVERRNHESLDMLFSQRHVCHSII